MSKEIMDIMSDSDQTKDFLRLFLQNQNRIYGFVFTLVPRRSEADDIMQDTSMIMWSKFSEFRPGTNFYAWATQIARHKIMKFRDRQKKGARQFSNEALGEILARNDQMTAIMDERLKALEDCLGRLKQDDKRLILMRYKKNIRIKDIALKVERSIQGMYKTMARIHNVLERCVSKKLSI